MNSRHCAVALALSSRRHRQPSIHPYHISVTAQAQESGGLDAAATISPTTVCSAPAPAPLPEPGQRPAARARAGRVDAKCMAIGRATRAIMGGATALPIW